MRLHGGFDEGPPGAGRKVLLGGTTNSFRFMP